MVNDQQRVENSSIKRWWDETLENKTTSFKNQEHVNASWHEC